MKELAIILSPIRDDYIERCLESLYKYTDNDLFYVILLDQTVNGVYEKVKDKVHFYIRPNRNLGFAKAANEGIIHAYRWGVPYIGVLNDDTEFMHKDWWQGIKDEFTTDEKILAVNPESPRVPLWGYGRPHGEYIDIIEYKDGFTDQDWEYLKAGNYEDLKQRVSDIPDAFPLTKRGVIDAIAMWFPIFKREFFEKVGYFDERFYPGGGEDYDLNARAYRLGYRLISSMRSWVWHWWGKSKDHYEEMPAELNMLDPELRWNDNNLLWPSELNNGQNMDPWGHYTDENGERKPLNRIEEVAIKPL